MDATQLASYALIGLVIAGATELINRLRAKDFWVVATIITAAIIGGLFGLSGYYPGLDAVEGIVVGLGTCGAITLAGAKKSTPAPSEVLNRTPK